MTIIYYLLTLLMFVDCVFLVFLVLVQLPKKEAGAGMAFGGAATDALFGAGSGNMLTQVTKWAAGAFFTLAILMALIAAHNTTKDESSSLIEKLGQRGSGSAPITAPAAPATAPVTAPIASTNQLIQLPSGGLSAPAPATPNAAPPANTNK